MFSAAAAAGGPVSRRLGRGRGPGRRRGRRPRRGRPARAVGEVSAAERRAYELVGRLPRAAAPGLWAVMQAGSLAAVFVAAGLALAARRPRLAADVAASGTAAWVAAKLVKPAVRRDRPEALLPGVTVYGRPQTGLGFPSGHAAVAAAMMTAASPHLSPPARAAGWAGRRPRRDGAHVRGRPPAAGRGRRAAAGLDGGERRQARPDAPPALGRLSPPVRAARSPRTGQRADLTRPSTPSRGAEGGP